MRRFGATLRRATPKGQDPSSSAQHRFRVNCLHQHSSRSGHTRSPQCVATLPGVPVGGPGKLVQDSFLRDARWAFSVGGGRDNGCVTDTALASAHRLLAQAADAVAALAESGSDDELLAVLTMCEWAGRRLDRAVVGAVAALQRRGTFADRGYKSTAGALGDLLGWERFAARRRVLAADQVTSRVGLDGAVLPARLPATATVFADGVASLRP